MYRVSKNSLSFKLLTRLLFDKNISENQSIPSRFHAGNITNTFVCGE
jgi:hypothetical protein